MLCLFLCKQITKNTNKSCNWRDYQRNLGPSGFPVCLALDMNICLLSQPQTFTSTQAQMWFTLTCFLFTKSGQREQEWELKGGGGRRECVSWHKAQRDVRNWLPLNEITWPSFFNNPSPSVLIWGDCEDWSQTDRRTE